MIRNCGYIAPVANGSQLTNQIGEKYDKERTHV